MKRLLFLVILPNLIVSSAAICQSADAEGSPLWWTLTDRLSPQELRSILSDREGHRIRQQLAVSKGMATELSEEELARLESFHQGFLFPELFPLWKAFDFFSLELHVYDDMESRFRSLAPDYGLSSEAMDTVLDRAAQHFDRCEKAVREGPGKRERFRNLVQRTQARSGRSLDEKNLSPEDLEIISVTTGTGVSIVQELYDEARLGPRAICSIPGLVQLRRELDAHNWESFRRYLFKELAPRTSGTRFEETEVNE